jgi:hypothetical protein
MECVCVCVCVCDLVRVKGTFSSLFLSFLCFALLCFALLCFAFVLFYGGEVRTGRVGVGWGGRYGS